MQETVDSMEVVRQMFEEGILRSAFWHQFAMTAHSPIGLHPEQFQVKKVNENEGPFANNDIDFIDEKGVNPHLFSKGLKISLDNNLLLNSNGMQSCIGYKLLLQDVCILKVKKVIHGKWSN